MDPAKRDRAIAATQRLQFIAERAQEFFEQAAVTPPTEHACNVMYVQLGMMDAEALLREARIAVLGLLSDAQAKERR